MPFYGAPMHQRLREAKTAVEAVLEAFLSERRRLILARSADLEPLVGAAEALTRRGGKRLRALLVYAGQAAASADPSPGLAEVAAAFELLQTYLLIQDDWMDQDPVRRGGLSVHQALRATLAPEHRADSAAILASDLAFGQSLELLTSAPLPAERQASVLRGFLEMHEEVVLGQYLDVVGSAEVEQVHLMKTAGYTVIWPLRVGARVAGAPAALEAGLAAFGRPLGLAFQLKDDLLGTFGDSAQTGKPAGGDLAEGKETALLAAARRLGADLAPLEHILGNRGADPSEIALARAVLERSGARAAVEHDLAERTKEAERALALLPITPLGRELLEELLTAIVDRER